MPIVYLNPIAGVYMIRCKVSGKVYIGSSQNIEDRWRRHKGELRLGKHHSFKLQAAWNKYGEDAFELVVLEVVACGFVSIVEQAYINKYDAFKNGYNCARLTSGGGGPSGEANGKSKLTQKRVDKIRHDFNHAGASIAALARDHGVSEEHVSRVLDNEVWRDENYTRTRKPTKTKELVAPKLTKRQVSEIRQLHGSGKMTRKQLAAFYNVNISQIQRVLKNEAWPDPSYVSKVKTIRKPTVVTQDIRDKVIRLYSTGEWTEIALAKYLDIPRSALQRIKKEYRQQQ